MVGFLRKILNPFLFSTILEKTYKMMQHQVWDLCLEQSSNHFTFIQLFVILWYSVIIITIICIIIIIIVNILYFLQFCTTVGSPRHHCCF